MQCFNRSAVRRSFAISVVLCLGLHVPTEARAQGIDGFINLLDNVIQNDMRNQQEKRRMLQEEQLYQREQQQVREQQQAEIDRQRRAEILMIKRLQSALGKLGFYTAKIDGDRGPGTLAAESLFTTAFDLPQLSLTEADVQQVEGLAAAGFRSREEIKRATAGGFRSRDELLAAEDGGFSNAPDYEAARQLGFDKRDAYEAFRLSGFATPGAFKLAAQGGFSDSREYEAAKAAGFSDRREYSDFLDSKLPDRTAFMEARAKAAEAETVTRQCREGAGQADVKTALATCMRVVALGAAAPPINDAFDTIGARLKASLADTAGPVTKGLQVATADGAVQDAKPDAGEFLVERAKLQVALRQHECGVAMLAKDWKTAEAKCQLDDDQGDSGQADDGQVGATINALHAKAVQEAAAADQAEEAIARQKKAEADLERNRLALAAAKTRMSALIANLSEFIQAKRTLSKPLDVAKAFVRLKQLQTSEDAKAIEQAILNIDALLGAEQDFQAFVKEQGQAQEIAAVNAKTTAIAEIRRTEAFIEDYIARNLLADSVNDLLTLQNTLAEAREAAQEDVVFNAQKLATSEIERLGLKAEIAAFVFDLTEPKAATVAQSTNGLAVTDSNRILLEGEPRDVLILGNFTAEAPNLVVNLLGETTFDQGAATYCWLGGSADASPLADHVLTTLRGLGAETLTAHDACTPASLLQTDIVLLPRGRFLQGNVLEARPVVEAFENQQLKLIKAVLWSELGETAEQTAKAAEAIRADVIAGLRKGFGLIGFDNDAGAICLVVPAETQGLHLRALAINGSALSRLLPANLTPSVVSLDRAFAGVQKRTCRAIYAGEADLARLLEGLARIQAAHAVIPVWIEPSQIAEGEALAQQSLEAQQKEIAARKQEIEAQEALARQQNEDTGKKRQVAEAALRTRYSQEAKAAFNGLSDMGQIFIRSAGDNGKNFADLFPAIGQWLGERRSGGWAFDKYDSRLIDYGTADWKGRRLESVLVEITVATKNPVRGEYASDCFVVGYLIDQEFDMLRDAVAESCSASDVALPTWQSSRSFESRWIAP